MEKKEKFYLIFLFFLAVSLRVAVFFEFSTFSIFRVPYPSTDEDFYLFLGRFINEGFPLVSNEVFYYSPLFGYISAFFDRFSEDFLFSVRLFNIFVGSTVPLAIYFLVKCSVKDKIIAFLVSIIAVFIDTFIVYDVHALKTTLGIALLIWGFVFFTLYQEKRKNIFLIISGVLFGLGSLIYVNFLLVFLFLFLYSLFRWRKVSFLFILPVVFIIGLTSFRNFIVSKDFIPVTAIGGIHFYIGNNLHSSGIYNRVPGVRASGFGHFFDGRAVAEKILKRKLKPSQVSSFWKKKAIKDMKTYKKRFFYLLLKKFFLSINYFDIPNNINKNFYKKETFFFKYLSIPTGLIILTGLAGFILSLREKSFIPVHIFFSVYLFSIVLFFITDRYRLPLLIPLLIYTAFFFKFSYKGNLIKKVASFTLLVLLIPVVFHRFDISRKNFDILTLNREVVCSQIENIDRRLKQEKDARKRSVLLMKKASIYTKNKSYEQAYYLLKEAVRLNSKNKMAKSIMDSIYKKYKDTWRLK